MRVEAVQAGDRWTTATGRVRATVYFRGDAGSEDEADPPLALSEGDRVEQLGALRPIEAPTNPGEFDYHRYAERTDLVGRLYSPSPANVRVIGRGDANPFRRVLMGLRVRVAKLMQNGLSRGEFGVMASMLLGYRQFLSPRLRDTFQRTGTVHYLAISGLHAGLMAGMLWLLLQAAHISRGRRSFITIVFLFAYGTLVGWRPSVIRAVAMMTVLFAAPVFGRVWDQASGIATAVLVVLIANPADLFNPGFHFSLAGVVGIVVLAKPIEERLFPDMALVERLQSVDERSLWRNVLPRNLLRAFTVSLAAWLTTFPLTAHHYHLFNAWTPLINVVVGLLVWLALALGLLLLVSGGLLGFVLLPLIAFASSLLIWTVQVFEHLLGARTYIVGPSAPWILAYYAMLALWLLRERIGLQLKHWLIAALLLVNAYILWPLPDKALHTRATFLDVGHGLATFVEFPDGMNMLFDAGSGSGADVSRTIIAPFLWSKGLKHIDLLVLSHADADHCNGLKSLADRVRIGRIVVSELLLRSPFGKTLSEWADHRGIPVSSAGANDELRLTGAAAIRVLGPPRHGGATPLLLRKGLSNDRSLVLMVESEGRRLLLTGDASAGAWALARQNAGGIRADVIQAPHHGRPFLGLREFLSNQTGAIFVASNKRGSMQPCVRDACRDYGVRLIETAEQGAVRVPLSPEALRIEHFCRGKWRQLLNSARTRKPKP